LTEGDSKVIKLRPLKSTTKQARVGKIFLLRQSKQDVDKKACCAIVSFLAYGSFHFCEFFGSEPNYWVIELIGLDLALLIGSFKNRRF
jgi:hypothetical protein